MKNFDKHGEIIKLLKGEHGLTDGFVNLIALKVKGSDAGSAENKEELIVNSTGKRAFYAVV